MSVNCGFLHETISPVRYAAVSVGDIENDRVRSTDTRLEFSSFSSSQTISCLGSSSDASWAFPFERIEVFVITPIIDEEMERLHDSAEWMPFATHLLMIEKRTWGTSGGSEIYRSDPRWRAGAVTAETYAGRRAGRGGLFGDMSGETRALSELLPDKALVYRGRVWSPPIARKFMLRYPFCRFCGARMPRSSP